MLMIFLGMIMKTLMERLMEDNGEHINFGCVTDVRSDSSFQPGVLTSKSFSKRIVIIENLLVETHSARLYHDNIDKLVALCMSKRFMEIALRKEAFNSIVIHDALLDEHASTNEEWKY